MSIVPDQLWPRDSERIYEGSPHIEADINALVASGHEPGEWLVEEYEAGFSEHPGLW